jgi:tetratricopeptide (TPR) repeat protein
MKSRILHTIIPLSLAAIVCLGCSVNTLVANALTGEGSSAVFTGDSDPQLVGDALPFAIKMYEALLDSTPKHQGLMLTSGSLFVMYANGFVQGPAEMLPREEWEERASELARAKQLYLRGMGILYDALEAKYPGFNKAAREGNVQVVLKKFKKADVGLLYWTVAGGMAAYSLDVFDFDLGARIPEWTAMIQKAYELDPNYGGATLDEFFIIFYGSLPEIMGGDREKAEFHFQQVLEKTGGKSAGAYISYAQSMCVPAQDYEAYKGYLEKAIAIDPDADPSTRLVTIINQRKAHWLMDNAWKYFSFLPIPDDFLDDY